MDLNDKSYVDWLTSVTPSTRQLNWQALGYYNFIHYGMNTYTGREWGTGKTPATLFNPTALDCNQWVTALKSSGSTGVIITAKHHDGFCLYPSKYTDYTVANSPYKNGKGDILKELSEACAKQNFKFGIYLSPWDMHEPSYGTEDYNDFYCNQLEEILTNYGELFAVWFDGACGEGKNGKKQIYDWKRYYDLIRKLQPNAAICICGPDVRWIGNEGGHARDAEWSVQSSKMSDYNEIKERSQQTDDGSFMEKDVKEVDKNLGSREQLSDATGLIWYPAEMDVSITRAGWFHHKSTEIFNTKKVDGLMELYNTSVGGNATLLLNVPPNKKGLMPKKFVKRLAEFGEEINKAYGKKIGCKIVNEGIVNGAYEYTINIKGDRVNCVELNEDITKSQRVESFELYQFLNGEYVRCYDAQTIGYKKFCVFEKQLNTKSIKLRITKCRNEPYILTPTIY